MINLTRTPYGSNFYTGHLARPGFQDLYRCLPIPTASIIINKLLDFMYSNNFTIKKSTDIVLDSKNISAVEELHYRAALSIIDTNFIDFSLSESVDKGTTKAFGAKFNGVMVRFFWHDSDYNIALPNIFCFNTDSHTCIDVFFNNTLANPENYSGVVGMIMTVLDALLMTLLSKTTNQEYVIANTGYTSFINVPKDSVGLAFFMDYYTKLFNIFDNIDIGSNQMLKDIIASTVSDEEMQVLFSKIFLLDSAAIAYDGSMEDVYYGHSIMMFFYTLYYGKESEAIDTAREFFGNIFEEIMYLN